MEKVIIGVIGAVSGLATLEVGAQATPAAPAPQPKTAQSGAQSYADLLDPIPNALAALRAADAGRVSQPDNVELAGYYHHRFYHHHHHHHHHHRFLRVVPPFWYRHHHHHHHNWYHHHHHHHHHWY
ncbi:MAG TPA: hypothetical protein VKX28_12890 [Xanthobacteraceae bacterium]|nr:hypothetical protein [Xanthobacteraceae bacterium]